MSLVTGDTDSLRTHSSNLDRIADGLDECRSAADTVSAHDNLSAYGAIYAPVMGPPVATIEYQAKAALLLATETLRNVAQAVSRLADAYEGTDRANAHDIDRTNGAFDVPPPGERDRAHDVDRAHAIDPTMPGDDAHDVDQTYDAPPFGDGRPDADPRPTDRAVTT